MFFKLLKQCTIFCALFVFFIANGYSQYNLVPNPSFEEYTNCPQGLYNEHPDYWFQPAGGGGGYLNACRIIGGYPIVPYTGLGFQFAKTGVAFIGMFYLNSNQNNYFEVYLLDSLKKNKKYYIEFNAVPQKQFYKLACNNVALLLTKQAIYAVSGNEIIPANPQVITYGNPIIIDTTQWTKVSSIYKAQGGEQYITLGNFKYANQTNYIINNPNGSQFSGGYFIDDVSVIPLDSMPLKADAGRDTTINIGDSAFIGSLTNGIDSIKWQVLNTNGIIDSIRPGFWVHPTVNTCYVVTQTVNGFTSSDTVCVNVLPLPLKFLKYEVRSTNGSVQFPSNGGVRGGFVENLWATANEINVSHFYIQRSLNGKDFITIGKVKANGASYNEYSYEDNGLPFTVDGSLVYYRIVSVDKDGKTNYSEVRNIEYRTRNNELRIFPNPVLQSSWINIQCKGAKQVVITDYLGSIVFLSTVDRQPLSVNTQQFTKGLYMVQVTTTNGELKTQKLIVE